MAYNISDYYESLSIEQHFRSRKARALAFLQAIGAKAVVLAAASRSLETTLEGMDDEHFWKVRMATDTAAYQIKRDLLEIDGVIVLKRARNGSLRSITIRLQQDASGDNLEWYSKTFRQKKVFSLKLLKDVLSVSGGGGVDAKTPSTSSRKSAPTNRLSPATDNGVAGKQSSSGKTTTGNDDYAHNAYARLSNEQRSLDIRFKDPQVTAFFIDWVKRTYFKATCLD